MYRLYAVSIAVAFAGCDATLEPSAITIEDMTGDEPREVVAAPGDMIQFRDLELAVPDEVGAGVGLVAELEDGGSIELEVENRGDGIAAIRVTSAEAAPAPITETNSAVVNPACSDAAFRLTGHRWRTAYRWYLSTANSPTAAMEAMIRLGADGIVNSRNDCGLADAVSATHQYLGRTSAAAAVGSGGTCPGRDGRNVVGMGTLTTYKAYTCWYWDSTNFLVEADIRFKANENWITTTAVPSGCVGRLHLMSVATHEFGHVFGLNHPSGNHPSLTMQAGGTCSASKSTLGFGDVTGLRRLY